LLAVVLGSDTSFAESVSEYDVKAAYLFNFLQFVTWPGEAFGAPSVPVRLCIVGHNPFGTVLAALTRNETVNGHPIEVATTGDDRELRGCHVAFIPSNVSAGPPLRAMASLPIVTVGETDGFLEAGGIIRFIVVNDRVRFDVNLRAAMKGGLTLSSRLLQVARMVER
jgi:hypothetical protein